jgi:carbamoyl-phosphate synthase small subunit
MPQGTPTLSEAESPMQTQQQTSSMAAEQPPVGATAALVLGDGSVFWGMGFGAHTTSVGEICFNTAMTGYQETLTDPSYAGQIITFTFPHIGNVGANAEDVESINPAARGLVVKLDLTEAANYRATRSLEDWLKSHGIPGIAGVDTRALTLRIRDGGAPNGVLAFPVDGKFDLAALRAQAAGWPGLEGMDLAKEVSCRQSYAWEEGLWSWGQGFEKNPVRAHKVVAVDYGAKRNILRCLADAGCDVTVVPATATAEEILAHNPDGVFLSNGPGRPGGDRRLCRAGHPGRAGHRQAGVRHLPGAPVAGAWRWAPRPTSWIAAIAAPTSRCRTSPPARWRSPARTTASRWMRPPCPPV